MGEFLIHTDTGQELVLEHHGVKGMQWGVRRYQYPDGTLTREGYIHYGVTPSTDAKLRNPYVSAVSKSVSAMLGSRKKTPSSVKNLGGVKSGDSYSGKSAGVHMDKGAVVSRIQAYKKEIGEGSAFVAGTKSDAERYEDVNVVKNINSKSNSLWGGRYRVQYRLNTDLDAPSEHMARALLGETIRGNKENLKATLNMLEYQSEQRNKKGVSKIIAQYQAYKDAYSAYKTGEASFRMISRLSNVSGEGANNAIKEKAQQKGLMTLSIRDEFYKNLSKSGYNAVLDYNDMGVMSQVPIIILDRDAMMSQYKAYDIVDNYKQKRDA